MDLRQPGMSATWFDQVIGEDNLEQYNRSSEYVRLRPISMKQSARLRKIAMIGNHLRHVRNVFTILMSGPMKVRRRIKIESPFSYISGL